MKTVVAVASVLAWACSLGAQITAIPSEDSTAIKIRNDAAVSLSAFVIRAPRAGHAPLVVYVDSAIDPTVSPLSPREERVMMEGQTLLPPGLPPAKYAIYEQPIVTAGIFADGTTIGDAVLLDRLMLRRCNMLQAVELALEMLSDAGRRNVPRGQLIEQFKKMADSARRWYVPPDQRVGSDVYQSIVEKLVNLREQQLGEPFPPTSFVTEETAVLNQRRVTLLESQPSLADAAFLRR